MTPDTWLICNTALRIAIILAAAFLAYHGKDGWGWLLFITILLSPTGEDA